MFRTITSILAVLTLVAVYNNGVLAADDGHEHHDHDTQKSMKHTASADSGIYTLLVDPLGDSLVNVAKPVARVHEGRQLLFASEKNVATFKKNPDKYLAGVDALIIKQQDPLYPLTTCVVSDDKLDMAGTPIQRVIGNRLVKFCCPGCIGNFKKDPAQYLSKIDAAVIASQKENYPLATCVVSGEKLGGDMGKPLQYVAGTQLVKFCCKGCVKAFEKNPAKYLSQLEAKPTKNPETSKNHQGHNH
ncbi:MAG: hypothetical protein JKX85_11910 [Phycisphaeraceae bacterium]|nr:hypothetical protein [Phycisphaeraceae bacterium]